MGKIKIQEDLWEQVEVCFKEQKACAFKMAVIEADKVLENLLTLRGIPGSSTEDRALKVKERFSDISSLMKAFEVKEKILKHLGYPLTSVEVDDALEYYKQAIVDIDSGGKAIPFLSRVKLWFEYFVPKEMRKIRNVCMGFAATLAVALFFSDTYLGREIYRLLVGVARFFYYRVVVIAAVAGIILGLVFASFVFLEKKNSH